MKLFFTGKTPSLPEADPRRDRSVGMPSLSERLLERHRARVLNPSEAPLATGSATPGGTIYRYNRVMLCHRLLGNDEQLAELDAAMSVQGLQVNRERLGTDVSPRFHRADLTLGARATPGTVDAWRVLQSLHGAVDGGRCSQDVLGRMRLEHVLVGSALQGAGAWRGAEKAGSPGNGSPETMDYLDGAYAGRLPVDLVLSMPPRRPLSSMPGGRRPVVAVLDTGVPRSHPAFEVSERQEDADTFVTVDSRLQDALCAGGDPESPSIDDPWDEDPSDDSLTGEVASHFGHGTFIAGIIRQVAPDAQVRAIRVMHNDGVVYENECLEALATLAAEAERARQGDETARPVDMVCLSFGYADEDPRDRASGALKAVIDRLTSAGVPVVCAAGNFASTRPFYPAAFSAGAQPNQPVPVLSVGALNPNGSVAMFSNGGPWVTCFATGASMVSAYPTNASGTRNPQRANPHTERYRESLDPDDFASGYAVWSGTSFAAPLLAGRLAAAMIEETDLAGQDLPSVTHRVQSALKSIGG